MLSKDLAASSKDCAYVSQESRQNLSEPSVAHVVVCNALGVGHYQPASVFVALLASSSIPLTITFFAAVRKSEEAKCLAIDGYDNVAYRKYTLDGEDVHPITMGAMITRKATLIRELTAFAKENCEKRGWSPVSVIVHDPFALFAREWGILHNVACVLFNPSNAFFWAMMKTPGLMEQVLQGRDDIVVHTDVAKIRGQLLWTMIQNEVHTPPEDREPVLQYFSKMEDMFSHACAVVGNDVLALYPWAIERVVESQHATYFPQPPSGFTERSDCPYEYYTVAPLCISDDEKSVHEELGQMSSGISLKYWLDQKEDKSVIYVALGTLYKMKREVVQALFESLKHCPFPFVWSYRELHSPPAITPAMLASLPPEKGVLLPWVHQKYLLMHRALRLFISHCGWNSTLENMCFGGLPTLCVPLGSDQIMNTIMLCDVLGCARLGMIQREDWNPEEMLEQSKGMDPVLAWQKGSLCPIKYMLPERAIDFSRLIREAADLHYNDLLLRAKEVQVKVLKAGSHRGTMILNVEKFAKFVTGLRERSSVMDDDYERQRNRVLLMTS